MKLNEILDSLQQKNLIDLDGFDRNEKHATLNRIKDKIMESDEFIGLHNCLIAKTAYVEDVNGVVYEMKTYKIIDDIKFSGLGVICDIIFTPPIYNKDTMYLPVKDGVVITPTIFNPQTLRPESAICLNFSPEELQDNPELTKGLLINKLKEALDNRQEFQRNDSHRDIMVRGLFEEITTFNTFTNEPVIYKTEIGEINLKPETYKNFAVSVMVPHHGEDDELWLDLVQKYYPNTVKQLFLSIFDTAKSIDYKKLTHFESLIKDFDGYKPTIKK